MQNKHQNFFFFVGVPTSREGGGGSSRLVQKTKFVKGKIFGAPLSTLLSLSFYLSFCMHALHCPPDSPSYRPPCLPPTFFPPPPPTHSCRAQLHSISPPARMHHISHLLHHLHILLFFPSNIMLHNNACVTLPTCLKSPRPPCIPLISRCPPPPTPSRHTQLH